MFRPLYYLGEKSEVNKKNHFWVLFHSAKSISDHFRTLKNFRKIFEKIFEIFWKILGFWCLILGFLCFHQKDLVRVQNLGNT